jgi:hypothetical protein
MLLICRAVSLQILNSISHNQVIPDDTDPSKDTVLLELRRIFGESCFGFEDNYMNEVSDKDFVMLRFCELCGIGLSEFATEKLGQKISDFHFLPSYIVSLQPRVKYPHVLEYNVGLFWLEKVRKWYIFTINTTGNKYSCTE